VIKNHDTRGINEDGNYFKRKFKMKGKKKANPK
jgi:hypothetical protein